MIGTKQRSKQRAKQYDEDDEDAASDAEVVEEEDDEDSKEVESNFNMEDDDSDVEESTQVQLRGSSSKYASEALKKMVQDVIQEGNFAPTVSKERSVRLRNQEEGIKKRVNVITKREAPVITGTLTDFKNNEKQSIWIKNPTTVDEYKSRSRPGLVVMKVNDTKIGDITLALLRKIRLLRSWNTNKFPVGVRFSTGSRTTESNLFDKNGKRWLECIDPGSQSYSGEGFEVVLPEVTVDIVHFINNLGHIQPDKLLDDPDVKHVDWRNPDTGAVEKRRAIPAQNPEHITWAYIRKYWSEPRIEQAERELTDMGGLGIHKSTKYYLIPAAGYAKICNHIKEIWVKASAYINFRTDLVTEFRPWTEAITPPAGSVITSKPESDNAWDAAIQYLSFRGLSNTEVSKEITILQTVKIHIAIEYQIVRSGQKKNSSKSAIQVGMDAADALAYPSAKKKK
jgi:hypothetical protein